MDIIFTVTICVWLMYKAGMITGKGWLTEMGKRPAHAPGPVPESLKYPNGSDLVKRTHTPKDLGLKKNDMKDLAVRHHMLFLRKPITRRIYGVYCVVAEPVLELDELYEYGYCLPVYFTWTRSFGKLRYEFYCPEHWFNSNGWWD